MSLFNNSNEQPMQIQEQEQQPSRYDLQFPGGYPMINPAMKETTIISQTDPKRVLEEFKHILRGEEEHIDDDGKSTWVKQKDENGNEVKPLMNALGIRYLTVDVFGANQAVVFSNYDDADLRPIVIAIANDVVQKLGDYMVEYEIDPSNLDSISNTISNILFSSYRRGMDQGERIFVKTVYSENNSTTINPISNNQERKKILGIF